MRVIDGDGQDDLPSTHEVDVRAGGVDADRAAGHDRPAARNGGHHAVDEIYLVDRQLTSGSRYRDPHTRDLIKITTSQSAQDRNDSAEASASSWVANGPSTTSASSFGFMMTQNVGVGRRPTELT